MARPRKTHTRASAIRAGFRSGFEQWFSTQFPELLYEPRAYPYVIEEQRTYKPDFVTADDKVWIETKGRFTADDRKKMVRVREAYPDVRIILVFQQPNNRLTKALHSQSYGEWATKNGFEWYSQKDVTQGALKGIV